MLSVLLNYTNQQDFTHFTNRTLKSPDIFGCWIKPTYISTGSEAFLSAVLRNRSAILDCILQSARPRSQAFKLFVSCLSCVILKRQRFFMFVLSTSPRQHPQHNLISSQSPYLKFLISTRNPIQTLWSAVISTAAILIGSAILLRSLDMIQLPSCISCLIL